MILHIDMDAFFASVEQASNPRLKNQPVAVASSEKRGVIITSSYEARKYGVKTGFTIFEAQRVCPHIKIVPANFEKYVSTSKKIIEIFKKQGITEVFSIDEAFIDIGDKNPLIVSDQIKKDIKKNFSITCSVGVGVNKDIAKLASGINKPDGFYWVKSFDQIKDIPIKEVCGIGKKISGKLALISVKTINDFVNIKNEVLRSIMGIGGIRLKMALLGELFEKVNPESVIPKSVSNSMTLPQNIWKKEDIDIALFQLSEKVAYRLRKQGLGGKRIGVYVRFGDFTSISIDRRYYEYTSDEQEIFKRAKNIINNLALNKPIRLLGISVTELSPAVQIQIFNENKKERIEAIDRIRERWGFSAITWGVLAKRFKHKPPISPAWRPEKP
ncbi:MAG: DNA polymerase IV [Proteobacteria bacterium]|nr:DNA polymerase IV [Pseudomonadota bacterium]